MKDSNYYFQEFKNVTLARLGLTFLLGCVKILFKLKQLISIFSVWLCIGANKLV